MLDLFASSFLKPPCWVYRLNVCNAVSLTKCPRVDKDRHKFLEFVTSVGREVRQTEYWPAGSVVHLSYSKKNLKNSITSSEHREKFWGLDLISLVGNKASPHPQWTPCLPSPQLLFSWWEANSSHLNFCAFCAKMLLPTRGQTLLLSHRRWESWVHSHRGPFIPWGWGSTPNQSPLSERIP